MGLVVKKMLPECNIKSEFTIAKEKFQNIPAALTAHQTPNLTS
jgi:hypothetical protein